jgi:hypothetical protein
MLLPEEVTILVALARSKAGAVGTYTQGNAVVNRAIMAITPDPEKILPDLLFYYFKNLVFQSSIQEKLMPGQKTYAPIGDIRKMLVSIPGEIPRQEQLLQRIEALLSGVKSAQDILQKNQNLMDHLLESALREVFISERMSKWETGKLSDQVDIQSGEEELQQNKYERYPFVNADDIDATVEQLMIDRSRMGSDLPTPAQGFILEHKPECLLYANIFTSDTHWRGRVAMPYYKSAASPEMLRCNSDLFALTIRSPTQLQPRFLFWALQVPGFIAMLQDHRQTQTRLKITEDQLQKSSLLFPKEHEEQERISTYLDAFQERLARMKESHDASRLMIDQMESSILDRAFRGEI